MQVALEMISWPQFLKHFLGIRGTWIHTNSKKKLGEGEALDHRRQSWYYFVC